MCLDHFPHLSLGGESRIGMGLDRCYFRLQHLHQLGAHSLDVVTRCEP
jgi:hypothetical protein